MNWTLALWVALGGAIGSVSRYAITVLVQSRQTSSFPTGTLLVNVTGSMLLGFLARWLADPAASVEMRLLLMTGICGGYTTFSTFSGDTLRLLQAGDYRSAALYITSSVTLSVAACFAGFALGRLAKA
jgi:CrcB protein